MTNLCRDVIVFSTILLLLMIAVVVYGATVVGSKHDISTAGEEVCVFCHTPPFFKHRSKAFVEQADYNSHLHTLFKPDNEHHMPCYPQSPFPCVF